MCWVRFGYQNFGTPRGAYNITAPLASWRPPLLRQQKFPSTYFKWMDSAYWPSNEWIISKNQTNPFVHNVVSAAAPIVAEAVLRTVLPGAEDSVVRNVFPGVKQNFLKNLVRSSGQRLLRATRRNPVRYAKSWRRPYQVSRKYRRKNLQFSRRRPSWKAKARRSSSKMGSYVRWKKGVSHRSSRMGYRKRF